MKRIYNYVALSFVMTSAVACVNSELTPDIPSAETGDDVKFSLSLQNRDTKTVYGEEDPDAGIWPIYWVDGDKVQIFSPQGLSGRRSAEYKVILPSGTDDEGNPILPYYAEDLVRTGEYGVQWGDGYTGTVEGKDVDGFHDFYSLYPSGSYTLFEAENGEMHAQGITISNEQNIIVNGVNVKSDMEDCLLYAATQKVKKGEIVNLHYEPISTVIEVIVSVARGTGVNQTEFTIQSVSIEANENEDIVGTFSLDVVSGGFRGFQNGYSTVTTKISNPSTGGYHTLANGESLPVPLFIAPVEFQNGDKVEYLNVKDWKVKVVANNKTYTKTLNINAELAPGQIHKITLPALAPDKSEWEVNNWIEHVDRNVYISEVSLPGSWNSLNSDFQGDNPSIDSQFAKGVRAFHIEARWSTTASARDAIAIDDFYTVDQLNKDNMYMSVADGNDGRHVYEDYRSAFGYAPTPKGEDYGQIMAQGNKSFSYYLEQITNKIVSAPNEYMVLICSFAQGSFNDPTKTGKSWMQAISDVCAENKYVLDASAISSKTMVGDVLGKVLVIVNLPGEINANTELPKESKCMFTYMPSNLTAGRFTAETDALLLQNNEDQLWYSSDEVESSDITIYNNQAQLTSSTSTAINHNTRGYVPTLAQRDNILNKILEWSKTNYGTTDYAHDKWLYLGLGGYQVAGADQTSANSDSYQTIATRYNKWIYNKIQEMGTEVNGVEQKYCPVGIVLMNNTTDESTNLNGTDSNNELTTVDVVKSILTLNNRYRLQYNPDYPTDYTPEL